MAKKKFKKNNKSTKTNISEKKEEIKINKYNFINYKKIYKKLLILPIILFLFSILIIIQTIQTQSTPIYKDITLKGGLSSVINTNSKLPVKDVEKYFNDNFKQNSFSISELHENGKRTGFIIDTDLDEKKLILAIENLFNEKFEGTDKYSSNYISSILSDSFFRQSVKTLIVSFLLMSIVIFLYFKELIPSSTVVLSGIFDLIVTVGILDFFKFKISIAGIGALLMLIGYSIDTDVLLTNRLIKEGGNDYFRKTFDAFKTGSMMSLTTLIAGFAAIVLTNSNIIFEISLILVIGLLVDYISTWIQNAGLLLWWLENKNKSK